MPSISSKQPRLLSYTIATYMLVALVWWAVLLERKNNEIFQTKRDLFAIEWQIAHPNAPPRAYLNSPDYLSLDMEYTKQKWMIFGEGLVFIIALLIGIWFINRGHRKEIEGIKQRRNFLLAITHELKSPLAAIKLVFETISRRQEDLNPSDQAQLLGHGLKESERLSSMVNNLLLSARLDKSYSPYFEIVDLRILIQKVVQDILKSTHDAHINCDLPSTPQLAEIDRIGIYSLVFNLAENALKYSPKGGVVAIDIKDEGNHLVLRIIDQGIGIAPEERRRIFDQFYRTGQEETRASQGSGIGLHIVRKVVELHLGQVEVKANQPKGSIFVVTLPKRRS